MSDIRVLILCTAALVASDHALGADAPILARANLARFAAPSNPPQAVPAAVTARPTATPELVEGVKELDARRNPLKDFRARFAINLKRKGRNYALKGQYAGTANGDFRLAMNWGIISIIDVACKGEKIDLWLPRKGKHCKGQRQTVRETENDLRLLERVGCVSELFFPDAWSSHAVARRFEEKDGHCFLNVIERCDGVLVPSRRVQLGTYKNRCVVEKTILYEKGKPIGAVEYRDYYVVGGWLIPRTVEVWSSAKTRISLTVEGIAINTGRALDLEVKAPGSAEKADLAETLKAGKIFE